MVRPGRCGKYLHNTSLCLPNSFAACAQMGSLEEEDRGGGSRYSPPWREGLGEGGELSIHCAKF